jgi:dihydropyrimidinase
MVQLIIQGGTCVTPGGRFEADLAVDEGVIVQIGRNLDLVADQEIDARGKLILPGLIDTHVHLPWPSAAFDSTDDYLSGTRAAACGGVTTIVGYVVPDDSCSLAQSLEEHDAVAEGKAYVDYSYHMIIRRVTPETPREMAAVMEQGYTSFKVYMAYAGFRLEDDAILTVLRAARQLGALICFHAEDGVLINFAVEQLVGAAQTSLSFYPEAHPRAADVEATQRVINYARYVDVPIHIVHVNTADGARLIAEARRSGQPVTGETCPHYLMFTDDVYRSGQPEAAYFVLAPVIRGEEDRRSLWWALGSGDLQTVGTDHCPYNRRQKLAGGDDFRRVPGGAGGIETSLPLLYTYGVCAGRLSLERLVEVTSTNPARIFGLYPRKGTLTVGSDADLVIYDPAGEHVIDAAGLHSNTDHTLYQGLRVQGEVAATILRGIVVAQHGELVAAQPQGVVIRRRRQASLRSPWAV